MILIFEVAKSSKVSTHILPEANEEETTKLIAKLDIGTSESVAQKRLNKISESIARITRLKPDNVQCQYLEFTHRGFQCKVCYNAQMEFMFVFDGKDSRNNSFRR